MTDDAREPIYPGGIPGILSQVEGRRAALSFAEGEAFPPLDLDLAPLAAQRVAHPDSDPAEAPPFRSSYHRKRHDLRCEFEGESELAFLNALLIANLRKRGYPAHVPALFQRLWSECGTELTEMLSPRWLVSSLVTFGDHGATETQRALGLGLFTLTGAMKLYEFERLHSGTRPVEAFPIDGKLPDPLPLDMQGFSLRSGGLDLALIGRLWQESERDAVIGPPAQRLLTMLVHDPGTVFRRLQDMRQSRATQTEVPLAAAPVPARAGGPRWGVATVAEGDTQKLCHFIAHHLDLGAQEVHVGLPAARGSDLPVAFRDDPRVRLTPIDADPNGTTETRRARFATDILQSADVELDWLATLAQHERLLAERPVADALAGQAGTTASVRLRPAEALSTEAPGPVRHFKLSHAGAGQPRGVIEDIYPTFGLHLDGGLLGGPHGRIFARTGLPRDVAFGPHALRRGGDRIAPSARLDGVTVGRLIATDWDSLCALAADGSEKAEGGADQMALSPRAFLGLVRDSEGEAGLRAFFAEVCHDSPDLRARLAARGMLLAHDLDPEAVIARVFGPVDA
ncbi:hypothetical protein ROJ8625_02067 [Roseivivax jejudonensis]|uniref:Uncharacterized protein n=1 Tax=Roseivivax jejudonensis TaxID=1529041 RepID=A0A1X6Z6R8_9RHOB|nr:hypothetical protein [Roseivivax jejudonensis]SLN42402.1 hypothetical protein ROJ8625_02067 [Roseivivax jejudonensis]